MQDPADATKSGGHARAPRRDARQNRESLIEAALRAIARDGFAVPVAAIATEAGLGVATFYRSFADRQALMAELEHRAYDRLVAILDGLNERGITALPAVDAFLTESLAIGESLILPLHGAPPLLDDQAVRKRKRIDSQLEVFLGQARAVGSVNSSVNATDVIICSALITQPLRQGPDWGRSATRHIALFVAGISADGSLPAPAIAQGDLEATWRARAGVEGSQAR